MYRAIVIGLVFAAIIKAGIVFATCVLPEIPCTVSPVLQTKAAEMPAEELQPTRAEQVMRALSAAHPNRIGEPEFRDGDWAFQVRGNWFYYAEGRILPGNFRDRAGEYRALGFNMNYPAELPSWESTAEQRAERTRLWEEAQERRRQGEPEYERQQLRRPNYFFEALWNITNSNEAWNQQVRMNFLGRQISIHSDISEKMRQINGIILKEAESDPAVRQWINSLGVVTGWHWRNVASSGNRSMHSYGVAIDLLPRNLGNLATYWLWSSRYHPQWWNIPFYRRYHPPDIVIRTFESFGFIWGGKWTNFDTMHFEYRPEIFILSGIELSPLRMNQHEKVNE